MSFFTPYSPAAFATDFLLNVCAILFATTLYASQPLLLSVLIASPAVLILLQAKSPPRATKQAKPPPAARQHAKEKNNETQSHLDPFPVHPFLTAYRGGMLVITCIAILAVDFKVFPRRFAKVENWGTSLMDLGVGSFVFSAGVVSARQILRGQRQSQSSSTGRGGPLPLARRLVAAMRHSLPLFVLGLIRLYSVKGLDYAEHVTEYGVHWNFFFTLALLPPFVEIFHTVYTAVPSYEALAVLVAVAYQVALESTDLKRYILVSPRGPDLLSQNREGVFSFFGYLAIFLAGRATGLRIIPRATSETRTPKQARERVLISLVALTMFWSVLFFFNSTPAFGYGASIPVSRRLANMPYVLWVAAFNTAQILLFCVLETAFFPSVHRAQDPETEARSVSHATSRVLAAFNKNGLALFLLANLLTGAVNLTVPTLDVKTWQAMGILISYAAVLTSVALALDLYNIRLKI